MNLAQAWSVFLVASMVGGLAFGINFGLVQAQSAIPTPSVPSFAVYYVDHPYDVAPVAPTYTTNPFTGDTEQTSAGSPGYHIDNMSIELWILNQQPSYSNGTTIFRPYYDVQMKGHFEQIWNDLYQGSPPDSLNTLSFLGYGAPAQSNSTYTVLSFSATSPPYNPSEVYPRDAQVDFQVASVIGHDAQRWFSEGHLMGIVTYYSEPAVAIDAMSYWSDPQTLELSNDSIATSTPFNPLVYPTPTPIPIATAPPESPTAAPTFIPPSTPTVPELSKLTIAPVILISLSVAVFFKLRKRG